MTRFLAFISYKHRRSSAFAENLERAIKAYAKPTLTPPPAIFRDEKYLKPGLDLPAMIQKALEDSEFLIFLASREAALSPWVRRELEWWCADPERRQRLIVVLTEGTLETEQGGLKIDWHRTDVLPGFLKLHLTAVPLYVDLSWARDASRQTLLDPDFKKAINLLVAALRRVDPIELSGQEILQHRRNVRVRCALVTAVSLLSCGLLLLAGTAISQARTTSAQVSLVLAESARRAIEAGDLQRAARLGILASRQGLLSVADPSAAPTLAAAAHQSSLLMDFRGHREDISGVEMMADGTRALTWSEDGSARVWDVDTGAEIAVSWHEKEVRGARFDPSGTRVLSWDWDGLVKVWDAETGAEIARSSHAASVWGALFDTAGQRVLSWDSVGLVRLWDAATGAEIATSKHGEAVDEAVFDAEEKRILSWSTHSNEGVVRVWDAETGEEIASSKHKGGAWGARFDPSQERVLSWGGRSVLPTDEEKLYSMARVWTADTGEQLGFVYHEEPIYGAVFDPSGGLVFSWNQQGEAKIWEAANGEVRSVLDIGVDVRAACFDPSGSEIQFRPLQGAPKSVHTSSGAISEISNSSILKCLGQAENPREDFDQAGRVGSARGRILQVFEPAPRPAGWQHPGRVYGATLDVSGTRLLTWADDGPRPEDEFQSWSYRQTAQVLDVKTGAELFQFSNGGFVLGASFDATGKRVLLWSNSPEPASDSGSTVVSLSDASSNGVARVLDIATGEEIASMPHPHRVTGAIFAPGGERVLSWGPLGHAAIWRVDGDAPRPESITFSPSIENERATFDGTGQRALFWDGNFGNDNYLRDGYPNLEVWDGQTGTQISAFRHEPNLGGAVLGSAGERVLSWNGGPMPSVVDDPRVVVWDASSGDEIASMAHRTVVLGAIFDCSGQHVLSWSAEGTARIWEAETGEERVTFKHPARVLGAVFDESCDRVLSWSRVGFNGVLRVWDVASGVEVATLGHEDDVTGARFDPSGRRVLSWGEDGIRVWDAATGAEIAFEEPEGEVEIAVFSPGGERVTGWSKVAQRTSVWDMSWAIPRSNRILIAEVCARKLRGAEVFVPAAEGPDAPTRPSSVRRLTPADASFAPVLRDRVGEDVCDPPLW